MHTMFFVSLLAQSPQPNPLGSPIVLIGVMMVMMYFLIIRPQSKQRKELEARIASMEKGDRVVTIGGLHASVHHLSEKTVTLKISEGVFVPFDKTAIQRVEKLTRTKTEDTPALPEK